MSSVVVGVVVWEVSEEEGFERESCVCPEQLQLGVEVLNGGWKG